MIENMNYYFAPMEGITNYSYRSIHHKLFPGVDKYFTPFLVANQTLTFKRKELKDVDPANNKGMYTVPQLMANKADECIWAAKELQSIGYNEINLNLGCPSGTVVSKKKGSGFLAYPEELDQFLYEVYNGLANTGIQFSIKTRLGRDDLELADRLMEIYNQYPVYELIIHPRTRKDMYKGQPRMDAWKRAYELCQHPVCYNGNLFSLSDLEGLRDDYPKLSAVMLGRGLIMNPALVQQMQGGCGVNADNLSRFLNDLWAEYEAVGLQQDSILRKFKEIWGYMRNLFPEGEKQIKQVRKAKNQEEYKLAVKILLETCPIRDEQEFYF